MHILVVDDHVPNRELLRVQLAGEGHRVTDVEDGLLALDILEREPIDAVISDILMPRMDGYRLCLELRRRRVVHCDSGQFCAPTLDLATALDVGRHTFDVFAIVERAWRSPSVCWCT